MIPKEMKYNLHYGENVKNEKIFYRISELMLATLIQRYGKKIILCLIQFKNERLTEILQAFRCHILWLW